MAGPDESLRPHAAGGLAGKLIVAGVVLFVAAAAWVGAYQLVIARRPAQPKPLAQEGGAAKIPPTTALVDFRGLRANVKADDPDKPAALIQYSVALACANGETGKLVEGNKQWFEAMLIKLHTGRTKQELNDPLIKESLLRQAKQEANALLARLQPEENPSIEVIDVLYTEYTIIDL